MGAFNIVYKTVYLKTSKKHIQLRNNVFQFLIFYPVLADFLRFAKRYDHLTCIIICFQYHNFSYFFIVFEIRDRIILVVIGKLNLAASTEIFGKFIKTCKVFLIVIFIHSSFCLPPLVFNPKARNKPARIQSFFLYIARYVT